MLSQEKYQAKIKQATAPQIYWLDQTLHNCPGKVRQNPDKCRQLIATLTTIYQGSFVNVNIAMADWQFWQEVAPQINHFRIDVEPSLQEIKKVAEGGCQEIQLTVRAKKSNAVPLKLDGGTVMVSCQEEKTAGYSFNPPLPVLAELLNYAHHCNLQIGVLLQNAAELPLPVISEFFSQLPADIICIYDDGKSLLEPLRAYHEFCVLRQSVQQELEFHAGNRRGLATANALAARKAGINRLAAAICGCNNAAALEELLLIDKLLLANNNNNYRQLSENCRQIMSLLQKQLTPDKSIIGSDIFAHESGIHVDGILKNAAVYEFFPPEEVGLERKLIIGKHSGTSALRICCRQWNIQLDEQRARSLLRAVRKLAEEQKGPLTQEQLHRLCLRQPYQKTSVMQSWQKYK